MAALVGVFLLVFLIGSQGARESHSELIVWNVGQGQWATVIDETACWHLDMGGEFAPWQEIMAACRKRPNRVSLSHWDVDHISFVSKARMNLPDICLLNRPEGPGSPHKERTLAPLSRCHQLSPFEQWSDPLGKTANGKSWVVLWNGILAPGDSPRIEEKKWIPYFRGFPSVRFLILGHHGSRTSTSKELLESLPKLQLAISSARVRRYGHPHSEVVRELSEAHVPLLRTEEWGTIHIEL